MKYTDIQRMRKLASFPIPLSVMPPAQNPIPAANAVYNAGKDYASNKWEQMKTYGKDLKAAVPEMQQNKADTGKAVVKGFADRTTDAANNMFGLFAGLPAAAGAATGNAFNKGIYWLLTNGGRGTGEYLGAPQWKQYMERYQAAIPESQDQIASVMTPLNNINESIQNSEALKENDLSGKAQEVARRLGGFAGTGAETMMYAGLGGYNGLLWALKHPISSFGTDLAFQYGLQDVRDNSLEAGAGRTYWQQAQEKANQLAQAALEKEYKETGVPDLSTLMKDRRQAEQYAEAYTPGFYDNYVQGLQYK